MTDIGKIMLGAALAIIGGIIGKIISVFVDEWRERKFIKRSLSDEIEEIIKIITSFKETYESAHQLVPSYLNQISQNVEVYNVCRQRLFLIWKKKLRLDIISFYRDLQKNVSENEGKLGSLQSPAGKTTEQNEIAQKFESLKTRAVSLRDSLNKFW